ncbi:MAG: hypothetical protein AAF311_04165 [Pseudomonadota bacterium]
MLLPSLIMFAITVAFTSLCFVPALFERKSRLLNFYWVGVWLFVGLIAALSGAEQTVMLAGYDNPEIAGRLLGTATLCFMLFVTFAWFRLSGVALLKAARQLRRLAY